MPGSRGGEGGRGRIFRPNQKELSAEQPLTGDLCVALIRAIGQLGAQWPVLLHRGLSFGSATIVLVHPPRAHQRNPLLQSDLAMY